MLHSYAFLISGLLLWLMLACLMCGKNSGIVTGELLIASSLNFGLSENCWKIVFSSESFCPKNAIIGTENFHFGELMGGIDFGHQ